MSCKKIQTLIPGFIAHSADEKQIQAVEEHLCSCEVCRQFLSQQMDKPITDADILGASNIRKRGFLFIKRKLDVLEYAIIVIAAIILIGSLLIIFRQ